MLSAAQVSAVFTTYMAFGGFLLVYSAMPIWTRPFFYLSFFRYAVFFGFARTGTDPTSVIDIAGHRHEANAAWGSRGS